MESEQSSCSKSLSSVDSPRHLRPGLGRQHSTSRHPPRTLSSGVALPVLHVGAGRKRKLFPTVAALSLIHACCLGLAFAQEVQQKQTREKDGSDDDHDGTQSLQDTDKQMKPTSPETKDNLGSSPATAAVAVAASLATATNVPTLAPTVVNFDEAEEEHSSNAYTALALNATLIVCVMMAYYVKKHKIYYLPESAGELFVAF